MPCCELRMDRSVLWLILVLVFFFPAFGILSEENVFTVTEWCVLFYRTVCITGVLLPGWHITLITHFTPHHVSHYTALTFCFLTHIKNILAILISCIIFIHFQHMDNYRSAVRLSCSWCVSMSHINPLSSPTEVEWWFILIPAVWGGKFLNPLVTQHLRRRR